MRLRIAFVGLATLSSVRAQVTVCFATYGAETTRAPATGLDLLIRVIPAPDALARRQTSSPDSGYLDSTGQIQPLCQKGSIFRLASGQLFSGPEQISVSRDLPFLRFAISESVGAINSTFAVATDGTLVWNNDEFDGRTARFDADSEGILYGVFSGSIPSTWTEVTLKVVATSDCPALPSSSSSVPSLASPAAFLTFPNSYANRSVPHVPTVYRTSSGSLPFPSVAPTAPSIGFTSFLGFPRIPVIPSGASPSSSPSFSSSFSTSNSSAITSAASSAATTTSSDPVPSFTTPSDPANAARSIISSNSWSDWCSELLGYTATGAFFTFESTIVTTGVVTSPSAATTTQTENSTSSATTTAPSNEIVIMVTPTYTTTISDLVYNTVTTLTDIDTTTFTPIYSNPSAMNLRARQASSDFITPGALQTYAASLLSSACSDYVSLPTSGPIVSTTYIMTIIQTSDTVGSLATVDERSVIPATTTISSGTITTVETFAVTLDISATDTTATVSLTDIEISTDTITVPTDYPNCDNLVSQVNGQPINIIDDAPNVVNTINDIDNAYDCCVICQTTVLCGAMYYMNGMCSMIMAETCSPNTSLGYFESIFSESAGYILSNGACGMLVHRGQLGDPSDG